MKTRILGLYSLFAFVFTLFSVPSALAVSSSALPIRRIYGSSPVLTWQYAQLVASTSKGIKGVQVNNTGTHNIMLAFGGSGGEVNQVIVGGLQDTAFIPLAGGYATRLSVISLDGPNETGELDVNVFYN